MFKKVSAVFLMLALFVTTTFANDTYVEVTNNTGFSIYFLYVSPDYSDTWEEDVLGEDVLLDGEIAHVDLSGYETTIFDIRLEDEDGDTYTIWEVDTELEDIVVTLDDLD